MRRHHYLFSCYPRGIRLLPSFDIIRTSKVVTRTTRKGEWNADDEGDGCHGAAGAEPGEVPGA
jgi:hypothetical protein